VPGRTDPEQITVFDSGGTGIETVAVANMLYQHAEAAGAGKRLSFEPLTY
jgi:alanine dehydrogenase